MVQISNTMDTASLVNQLMSLERIPQDQLRTRVAQLQSRQSAWNQLGSQVTALQNAADALAPMGSLGKLMAASSSSDASVGIRVTGVASASTSTLEVLNLAATHSVVSADTFSGPESTADGRALTLTIGGTPTSFTSTDGSIGGLVDAVNASGKDVKAKMLQTAPGTYQMVLTATKSGTDAAFTTTGSTGWTGLTTSTTGVNAQLKVDGVTISRASNVVTDLIDGAELTLKQVTTAPVQVAVTRDDNAVVNKVKDLVDAANTLINTVKKQTATSATAASRGILAGDTTAIGLADEIRNALASGITGSDGVVRPISKLGVSLSRDGSLKFDAAALRASLTDDPTAVAAMLGRGGSSTIPNVGVNSVLSTTTPGPHAISITQIASASALVGVPVPAPPPGSTINMTVMTPNGTTTVAFAAGNSYAQTAANLTSAMIRSGLSLEATTDGTKFTIAEKRAGSKYTFSLAGASDLGIADGAAVAGTDVLATIDGKSITGTGAGLAAGGVSLTVKATAQQLADASGTLTGTFTVSDGFAGLLARIGGKSVTSTATTAKNGLDSQIKDLQQRIDRYDDTLQRKETTLKAKFTAMDTVLTRLQGQMSQLSNFTSSLG